jgi:energy-coupling factor transporter ATP-binding protein EcfA2
VASFGRNNAKASPPGNGRRAPVRSEPGIAMLGATGSGKSTFLGALQIALLKQHREWRIWCRDPASRRALVEMNIALTSEGRFPLTTMGIDIFDWILSGKLDHAGPGSDSGSRTGPRTGPRTGRAGRFNRTPPDENVELALKLTDPTGELSRPDQAGLQPREQLVDHVAKSRGILYMFDPIREFNRGDAYDKTYSLLMDLIAAVAEDPDFDGRLPHHVAVCVTKLDDPRVFKTAESLGMLVWDEHDPLGFPRVHDSDARDLMHSLCKVSRNGTGEVVPQLLEQYFHPDRISYFVTSAVGFMLNKRTRVFDIQDTENVYRIESGESLVRGPVNPINVVEPMLWLVRQLALNA